MISENRNRTLVVAVLPALVVAAVLMLQGCDRDSGKTTAESPGDAGSADTVRAMPTGHPPVAAGLDATAPAQSGSVTNVDPDAHFTHFRVGQRNVKTIFPDGDIVWVGTSAGVIRYDATNEDYRLFDTRTGLLANGVFYLGKINGRLAVGTYGGGLSILNEAEDDWRIYNIPDGLGDGFIYDALQLDNGDVWDFSPGPVQTGCAAGTWTIATAGTFTRSENTDGALPNDWVYALHAGKNGEVWFATEGGLAQVQG